MEKGKPPFDIIICLETRCEHLLGFVGPQEPGTPEMEYSDNTAVDVVRPWSMPRSQDEAHIEAEAIEDIGTSGADLTYPYFRGYLSVRTPEGLQQPTHVFQPFQNLEMDEQRPGGARPFPGFGKWKFGKLIFHEV